MPEINTRSVLKNQNKINIHRGEEEQYNTRESSWDPLLVNEWPEAIYDKRMHVGLVLDCATLSARN